MIISQNVATVEFGGLEDSSVTSFGIKQSAEAFMILSSTLYTNKIQAIIREVSCNAVDAHAMVGTPDLPIEVHLPTYLEPHFHVRDFGTGLSDEDIRTVYTVYFESTKRASNNQVGGFGLGCKSPFSYTQNFTITSIFEGKKTIYSAFINDKGFPDIINLGVSDSDEHTGITVSFPVKDSDISRFKDEARYVYSFFKVKPNMVGENVDPNTIVTQLQLTDDSYTYTSSMWNINKCYAVVGGVSYPITLDSSELQLKYSNILSSQVINEFGIGELSIHPSRETLSYDKRTIDNIIARFDEITNTIYNKVNDELSAFTNAWELTRYYDIVKSKATTISRNTYSKYKNENISRFIGYSIDIKADIVDSLNLSVLVVKNKRATSVFQYKNIVTDSSGNSFLSIETSAIIDGVFVSDGQPKTTKRIRQYLKELSTKYSSYVVIEPKDLTKPFDSDKVLQELRNPLNIITMDDLPEIVKAPRVTGYTRRKFVKGLFSTSLNYLDKFEKVQTSVAEISTTKYYVVIDDDKKIKTKVSSNPLDVSTYQQYTRTLVGSPLNSDAYHLYAVLDSELSNIVDSKEWVNYDDMMYKELVKKVNSQAFINAHVASSIDIGGKYEYFKNRLDKDNKCMVLFDKYNSINNNKSHMNIDMEFVKTINPKFEKEVQKEVDIFNKMIEDVETTYPMLNFVGTYCLSNKTNLETVLNYIKTTDNTMKGTN